MYSYGFTYNNTRCVFWVGGDVKKGEGMEMWTKIFNDPRWKPEQTEVIGMLDHMVDTNPFYIERMMPTGPNDTQFHPPPGCMRRAAQSTFIPKKKKKKNKTRPLKEHSLSGGFPLLIRTLFPSTTSIVVVKVRNHLH